MLYHSIKIKSSYIPEEEKADNIALGKIFLSVPNSTVGQAWSGNLLIGVHVQDSRLLQVHSLSSCSGRRINYFTLVSQWMKSQVYH